MIPSFTKVPVMVNELNKHPGMEVVEKLDLALIEPWLKEFGNYESTLLLSQINQEKDGYSQLFEAFAPLSKAYEEGVKRDAPDYNLFRILNIRHYETKVHTPFLRHLFDPNETHMQGALFVESFLKVIFGDSFDTFKLSRINVTEELPFADGRIDLLIEYFQGNQRRAIVIENKIYHTDEPNQLGRYYQYLTESLGYTGNNLHMVYLKPRAGLPGQDSIDSELLKELLNYRQFSTLGYYEHIYPMLYAIMTQEPKLPSVVRETIKQYLLTIRSL